MSVTKKRMPNTKELLAGTSPNQRAREKLERVVTWIRHWGFTSGYLISALSQAKSPGYSTRLVSGGMLNRISTECGGWRSGVPRQIYTLTNSGLELAERLSQHFMRYPEIDPLRVNQQLLRHDICAQLMTFHALAGEVIVGYETERIQYARGDRLNEKIPDVIWIINDGVRIAVEIELSAKWDRKFDEFRLRLLKGLYQLDGGKRQFDRVLICSDSPALLARYRDGFLRNDLVIWEKNSRGHWYKAKTISAPDWAADLIDFKLIDGGFL